MVGRYSATVADRRFRPVLLAGVLMLSLLGGARLTAAQEASPAASPAAQVDCTAVLGIGNPGDACINVVHASPAAEAVDVYMDGELALGNLAYKQASGVVAVVADYHTFVVVPAGSDIAEATPIASFNHNFLFAGGDFVEFVIVGAAPPIFAQAHEVDLSALPEGTSRVRAVHASADAGTVDVATTGGELLAEGLSFPRASAYVEQPAGSLDLDVLVSGTTEVALSASGDEGSGSEVISAFVVGLVADGSLDIVLTVYPLAGGAATPVPVVAATPTA